MRNDAVLIQTCASANPLGEYGAWSGVFYDMLRLALPRHSAYARAHNMDYWAIMSDVHPEMTRGAWPKIWLLRDALEAGYQYAAYLDTDAVVWNMDCDLRDALPGDKAIGAARHDPAKSEYLRQMRVPAHHNVGALYVRNTPGARAFLQAWLDSYPGHQRWMEQGSFNELCERAEFAPIVAAVDDTWNSTVNVNLLPNPNVMAWHGVMPPGRRLDMIRQALANDCLKFRV